ncbi:MAG: DUF115 domain-containing protein, partial [Lentisphaerae bacterium]
MVHLDLSLYVHPVYRIHRPEILEKYSEAMEISVRTEIMNRGTLASFGEEWFQNALLNLHRNSFHPPLSAFKKQFAGWKGLMVAAGPSLDKSIEKLKSVADQSIVVCVGQAFRALVNAGIQPDFVVAVDSDPRTFEQFRDVPTGDTILVAGDNVYPPVLEHFGKQVIMFSSTLTEVREWLKDTDLYQVNLAIGGTVSLSAIDLLVILGCKEIFLVGLDLCFREDGTTHASHTQWTGYRADTRTLVKVPGNYQETVMTSRQFAIYIHIIEGYLKENERASRCNFHNVNTSGARIQGTEVIDPDQLQTFFTGESPEIGKKKIIRRIVQETSPPAADQMIRKIDSTEREIDAIKRIAFDSVQKAKALVKAAPNGTNLNKLIKELDRNDQRMSRYETGMELLNCAIRSFCMDVVVREGGELADQVKFYRHLEGGADWLLGLFAKVKQNLM